MPSGFQVDNISNLLVIALLTNCVVLKDDNKLRDVILFAVSAVPANGCLYVDNICNLLVAALLENCVVSRDDNKLRDVMPFAVSAVPANGCLYVDNTCILLVVVLLENCVESSRFIKFALVLFESTFVFTAFIKVSADTPFNPIHAAVASAIELAIAIKPVEGIAGIPKLMSPGLPSVPSSVCKRRFKLVS